MIQLRKILGLSRPLAVLALACLMPMAAVAQDRPALRYVADPGTDGWTPYITPQWAPERPGILIELTRLILDHAGIRGEELPLPARRSVTAYKSGQIDFEWASPAWFSGGEFPETDLASDPVLPVREVLIFPEGQKQRWLLPYQIYGHTVGTIEGYTYYDSSRFRRHNVKDERTLVQMVAAKRLDVAIIGELPGRYWAGQLGAKVEFGPVHSEGLLAMRLQGKHLRLMSRINDAIRALHQDGTVNRIVSKYIGALELN